MFAPSGRPGLSGTRSRRAYHDREAVVSLDTVLVTLLFGVLAAPHLSVGGKIQVVVHDLAPQHEQQGPVLVQNILTQVACNLVGDLTGLQEGKEGEGGRVGEKCALRIQIQLQFC